MQSACQINVFLYKHKHKLMRKHVKYNCKNMSTSKYGSAVSEKAQVQFSYWEGKRTADPVCILSMLSILVNPVCINCLCWAYLPSTFFFENSVSVDRVDRVDRVDLLRHRHPTPDTKSVDMRIRPLDNNARLVSVNVYWCTTKRRRWRHLQSHKDTHLLQCSVSYGIKVQILFRS